jgi:hypothetical protein
MIPVVTAERATPEVLGYAIDFTGWQSLASDTITSGTVTEVTSTLVFSAVTVDSTKKMLLVTISGGVAGTTYRIVATAVTTGGQTLVGYIDMPVETPP